MVKSYRLIFQTEEETLTKKKIITAVVGVYCLLSLTACSGGPAPSQPTPSPEEFPSPTWEAAETPAPRQTPGETEPSPAASEPPIEPEGPLTDEEIGRRYEEAMAALRGEVLLDVSGREWKYGMENGLRNIYYSVLARRPELKYTYDMTVEETGDGARCFFHYMPYRTGAYAGDLPAGSHSIGSLHDADVMAQSMIDGTERISVAITDPELKVDDLQRAVGQAGYGWLAVSLSKDGTQLVASPVSGMTLSECAAQIEESFALAGELLEELVTGEMTQREKLEAVYGYITEKVSYDFRYYSGKNDMPYASTVALGALRDSLAVCGGYAHALETMLDMCGIENYTVSGTCKGEYHAWNYVVLEGEGYYCDPTADRHGMRGHFLLTGEELEEKGGYVWDSELYPRLRGEAGG